MSARTYVSLANMGFLNVCIFHRKRVFNVFVAVRYGLSTPICFFGRCLRVFLTAGLFYAFLGLLRGLVGAYMSCLQGFVEDSSGIAV